MKKVLILGSTGSIGTQTIDVCKQHPEKLQVVGLSCNTHAADLLAQAEDLGVGVLTVTHPEQAEGSGPDAIGDLSRLAGAHDGFFGTDEDALIEMIRASDADIVVNALVGAAGLRASYETLKCGHFLALANKESLVVGGDIIMPLAHNSLDLSLQDLFTNQYPCGKILPIDSEHGAIFQCLIGEDLRDVSKLLITASGGPFFGKDAVETRGVTAAEALSHPTWNMGPKITIDSATMMNKGLEVIEAHHLFGMPFSKIEVVVQRQSLIHSMVEFRDGSVKAQLGPADMRIPIQFALSYPQRWVSAASPIDFSRLERLDFGVADISVFRCLDLAIQAGRIGGTMPCAMNAADEAAVDAYLKDRCGFFDIADCVEDVMDRHAPAAAESVDQLMEIDGWARSEAQKYLQSL